MVGLGISGISTALRLHQIGWTPVVIEKMEKRRTGGYFVGLFGAGRAASRRLGIDEQLADRASRDGANFLIDRRGNRRLSPGFTDLPGFPHLMLRGDVEKAAFEALPADVEIRYGTTPVEIEQDHDGVNVILLDSSDGTTKTERFDLVVGADGVRSTVRRLAFGPPEKYRRRFDYIVAAFQLPDSLSDLARGDGAILLEPGRSLWVFPFSDHAPTAMLSYRTDDVDAEFTRPPAERVRAAFGDGKLGRLLEETIAVMETSDEMLFDSVEQVKMDSWSNGRVVLVGDAAWCVTLWAGMGVSAGLAGADLLGSVLERYPDDLDRALREWESQLRPYIEYYQRNAHSQRAFFTPKNRFEIILRNLLVRGHRLPVVGRYLDNMQGRGKAGQMKDADIANLGLVATRS